MVKAALLSRASILASQIKGQHGSQMNQAICTRSLGYFVEGLHPKLTHTVISDILS